MVRGRLYENQNFMYEFFCVRNISNWGSYQLLNGYTVSIATGQRVPQLIESKIS